MFTIVVSKSDLAGMNFFPLFTENFGFRETGRIFDGSPIFAFGNFELLTINSVQIFADFLDKRKTDFFIFASKHSSTAKKPSLTAHAIGNFSKAEFGGKDFELCPSSAFLSRNYLLSLKEQRESLVLPDFEICLEATHHGPFLKTPSIFIELGSSEKEWLLKKPAEAVVETILKKTSLHSNAVPCIGIGGGHYAPGFTKRVLNENFAFSHIAAEYSLPHFTEFSLQKMVSNSIEKPELIVADRKGLGKSVQKNRIQQILQESGIEILFV
ncbi:MAG: D-aminoacyl-tRNA deacylase [Candidatus ainarchaeum sp.]|nr:D-aminoacyl-tRNA deacylase [Candidatus ainarchaeum sp.]